jgi:dihydropteroate synthase
MAMRSARFASVVRGAVARRGAALMGICNVTPDSFSDGGRFFQPADARDRIDDLLSQGADIVDIGGESTRPGSKPVPPREQLERILPVIQHAVARGACISVDTTSAVVAAACLDVGAHAVNDVSLLREEELARVVAGSGAAFVLSHARGPQEAMRGYGRWPEAAYGDVVADVVAEWERAAARAGELGVPRSALVMDPGLGFSKASRHSFELVRRARELVARIDARAPEPEGIHVPVLFGASRKSFLTLIDPDRAGTRAAAADRDGASIAAALHAVRAGVEILRVHDVRATRQAIDMDNVLRTNRRKI